MGYPLSKRFSELPDSEKLRIQKKLGVILKKNDNYFLLKKVLTVKLKYLGHPSEYLASCTASDRYWFDKLLCQFGILSRDQIPDSCELKTFTDLPYVIQDSSGNIRIISEALDLVLKDPGFIKKNYLLHYLHTLSLREKKAWSQWLRLIPQASQDHTTLTRLLWNEIGAFRARNLRIGNCALDAEPELFHMFPQYLEDIFDPSDIHNPMYWFFRQVTPLYKSLQESREHPSSVTPASKKWLKFFKYGYFSVKPEEQGLGKPVRWKIIPTAETAPPVDGKEYEGLISFAVRKPDSESADLLVQAEK